MAKVKAIELSPQAAAQAIGVTDRTVLNFISQKRFEAIKIGREWFIDEASFIAFCLRYGYHYKASETNKAQASFPSLSPSSSPSSASSSAASALSAPAPDAASNIAASTETQSLERKSAENKRTEPAGSSSAAGNERSGVFRLRSYGLLIEVMQALWRETRNADQKSFASEPLEVKRCYDFLLAALSELGAGYYAFGVVDKCKHYRRARSHLGSVMALMPLIALQEKKFSPFLTDIEQRVIPAITALLRKLENKKINAEARR